MLELEAREAYERLGPRYPPYAHNALMKAEQRAVLAALPARLAGHKVLDLGCGTGRYMRIARERAARDIVGIDISLGMLRANQEDRRVQATLASLPINSDWADLVVCALVLGHVDVLGAALGEIARVSRAGARILCTDIHPRGAARGWRRSFRCGDEDIVVKHYYRDTASWQHAAGAAGLQVRRVTDIRATDADIGAQTGFDPAVRELPVAILYELGKSPVRRS